MDIAIDASMVAALAEAWRLAPEIVREEMLAAVTEADALIRAEVKDRTPVGVYGDSGLRGSIFSDEQVLADNVLGVTSTSVPYAIPVELGTRPHFPPVQALVDWVVHKLGVDPEQADQVAFLVARKIGRVGTKGAFMFKGAMEATQSQVLQILGAGVARVGARLAAA